MGQATGESDVLVVGAGPTGLTLASEIARHGATVRLIDAAASHPRVSKATALMPRTLEMLDRMGAIDAFLDAGSTLAGLSLYSSQHKIFELTSDDIDSPYPFVLGLEQFRTEELLTNHASSLGVQIEHETTMTRFNDDGDGVSITLNRVDGSEERIHARYLVGCDGAHSITRKILELPFDGDTITTDHFAVAYLPISWDLPNDRLLEFHSHTGTVIITPLPRGLWSIMFELDPDQWASEPQDVPTLSELQAIMDVRSPVQAKLSEPLWVTYFRINHRQVPSYRVGRVFLAGDAAHIHSPAGGQGMNTGMQDALNLGWKLAHVCRGDAPETLLDSYHDERYPVGREVLRLTTALQTELDQRNRIMMALRDHAIQGLNHVGIARRTVARLLGELSYHYRDSPLVHEDHGGSVHFDNEARHPSFIDCRAFGHGPRAGDRAPDLSIGASTDRTNAPRDRLLDLLRESQYILLLFEGTHRARGSSPVWSVMRDVIQKVQEVQPQLIQPIVVVPRSERPSSLNGNGTTILDADGTLHHRYGARGQCLYLIRPDGYIAYRSEPIDPDKFTAYLSRILNAGRDT